MRFSGVTHKRVAISLLVSLLPRKSLADSQTVCIYSVFPAEIEFNITGNYGSPVHVNHNANYSSMPSPDMDPADRRQPEQARRPLSVATDNMMLEFYKKDGYELASLSRLWGREGLTEMNDRKAALNHQQFKWPCHLIPDASKCFGICLLNVVFKQFGSCVRRL